jgi:protein-S-isoprenylcysteine O-methyltransferase Ste14
MPQKNLATQSMNPASDMHPASLMGIAPMARTIRGAIASQMLRYWVATPDWVFRALGAIFWLTFVGVSVGEYFTSFPNVGPAWRPIIGVDQAGRTLWGPVQYFPIVRILVDLTFIQIALSCCFRRLSRQRAMRASQIVIPIIASIWPLLPFLILTILRTIRSAWLPVLARGLAPGWLSQSRIYLGVALLSAGLTLEVWGYATLFRSFSIVAEARALITTGPYRLVRHPIYLGQFIAQAGFWLVLVKPHWYWWAFCAAFFVLQLYRARVEEQVMENAFGQQYRDWRAGTPWFP